MKATDATEYGAVLLLEADSCFDEASNEAIGVISALEMLVSPIPES